MVLVLLRAAAEGVTVVRLARLLVGRLDAAVGEAVAVAVDVVAPAIVVRRGGVVFVVTEGRGGLRVVVDRAARVDEDVLVRDADGLTAVAVVVVLPALPLLLAVLGVVEVEEEAEVLVRAAAAGRVDVDVVGFRASVEDVGGGFLAAFIEASSVRNRVAGGIQ